MHVEHKDKAFWILSEKQIKDHYKRKVINNYTENLHSMTQATIDSGHILIQYCGLSPHLIMAVTISFARILSYRTKWTYQGLKQILIIN